MQTLHRVRDQLVGERAALMNQIRAVLLERGHIVPQGRAKLAASLESLLYTEAVSDVTPWMRSLVADVRERWQSLHRRIAALDAEFADQAWTDESARRLTTIPGVGALNATALVAAIGDVGTFARRHDLAAWLGLVPGQLTPGGRPRILGITKRESKYLSKMLIQGARAAMPTFRKSETRIGEWLRGLLARAHATTAVVALAAKKARTVWALLRHERVYEPAAVAA